MPETTASNARTTFEANWAFLNGSQQSLRTGMQTSNMYTATSGTNLCLKSYAAIKAARKTSLNFAGKTTNGWLGREGLRVFRTAFHSFLPNLFARYISLKARRTRIV